MIELARNTAAKNLLQNKISNSKGNYNPHNGKLAEDDDYTPIQPKKAAEKSAVRSSGGTVNPSAVVKAGSKRKTQVVTPKAVDAVKRTLTMPNGRELQVSTPRQTNPYLTSNMGLSNEEIFKKYESLAKDTSMDYKQKEIAIGQAQKELGKMRDKHLISSMMGNQESRATVARITDLQNSLSQGLKSTAFGAGFGKAAGLGAYNTIAKKASHDEKTQAQFEKQEALEQAAAERFPTQYKGGQIAGELTKAGILYGTAGAAAETGVGALLKGKELGKAGAFAARILGQQAADTVVNTPFTILEGIEKGKSKKEIAKDIGKQEAMDAAFNIGMGAIGAGVKTLKNVRNAEKNINNIPIQKMEDVAKATEEKLNGQETAVLHYYGITDINKPSSVVNGIVEKIKDTFLSTKENVRPIINEETQLPIEIWKNGINETFWKKKVYGDLPKDLKLAKIESIEHLPELIRTGKVRAPEAKNYHDLTSKSTYVYLENEFSMHGKDFAVTIDIKKLPDSTNRFYIHDIKIKEATGSPRDSSLSGPHLMEQPSVASNNNIPGNSGAVKGISAAETMGNAAKTQREEAIQDAADGMVQGRNVLAKPITKEERKALELEHTNLQNASYRSEKLREISEATGGDPEAIRKANNQFDARMKEIEGMLSAQEVLRTEGQVRAEAADEIAKIFNIREKNTKKKIKKALQKVMEEAKSGEISTETREGIFNALMKRSEKGNNRVNGLRNKLRNKKILLDVEAAADIADINEWNKALIGKVGKIKIGRESNVEDFYAELSKAFPSYFPESIDRPAEQMLQIRKIAEMLESGGELEATDYKKNFNRVLDRLLDDLDVRSAYREKAVEKAEAFQSNLLGRADYGKTTPAEVNEWYAELHRLQETAKANGNELTAFEERNMTGLLNDEMTLEEAKQHAGDRWDIFKAEYDLRKPVKEMEDRIAGWKKYRGSQRYDLAMDTVGDIHIRGEGQEKGWHDKVLALGYGRETQERNLYDIAPDKETADRMIDTYFTPIHNNERDRMLMMNDYKGRIEKLKIDTRKNIRLNVAGLENEKISESGLVQWLGENRYELQKMKASGNAEAAELEKLIKTVEASLTPQQMERINAGIDTLRGIYEELHPLINEVLIRNGYDPIGYIEGYFPHMNFDDPNGFFESAASKLGFNFASKELPMDIAGRTEAFKPGKKWAGNLLSRTGEKTDYDALRAFDQYIDNISDVIYHTDDIRNLRSLEDYFRYTLSDEGLKKEIDAVRSGISTTGEVIKPEDIPDALEKLYNDKGQNHKLQNYVNNLRLYTDLLAGKKHSSDRDFEKNWAGRQFYQVMGSIKNNVAANMVAGNLSSALTNFIPITQSLGTMSMGSRVKGLEEGFSQTLHTMLTGEMDDITKKSAFLTTRGNGKMLYRTGLQKVSEKAGVPMEFADTFSTQAVWRGRFYDNLKKGLTEDAAIKEADSYARGLFAGRSKGAMPTMFHSKSPIPMVLSMFQLEVNNGVSHIAKDIPRNAQGSLWKMARAYSGMVIGAYVYNDLFEKATGRRSALDPFGIANEAIGDFTGTQLRNTVDIVGDMISGNGMQLTEETKKEKPSAALGNIGKDVAENIPFIGGLLGGGRIPISSAFADPRPIISASADMKSGDMAIGKGLQTIGKELAKPGFNLLMPFGGGQLYKTLQGANTMRKGGRYNETNKGQELQFAVDKENPANWVEALLFGQWATKEGREYMENSRQKLGVNQTETYKKLVDAGTKNTVAFDTINLVKAGEDNADKRKEIRKSGLSKEQQGILFYDLAASPKEKDMMDRYGADKRAEVADVLSRLSEHEKKEARMNMLRQEKINDRLKRDIFRNMISDNEYDGGDMDQITGAGMSMDEFLRIKAEHTKNKREGGKQKEKMKSWLDAEGYSYQKQKAVIEAFGWKWNW